MKKKSIGKNYIYNIIYEVLTVLVPLVTTPYISRVLGAEKIGIYSYTNSIVTFFALFAALGTTVYARREIAYYQDDEKQRSATFWEVLIFRIGMTAVCLILYLVYAFSHKYVEIALVQSFYVIAVACDVSWVFQGMEDFGTVVLRNSLVKIVNIFFIFIFVRTENDLIMYVFGLSFLPILASIVTWIGVPRYVRMTRITELHPLRHFKGAMALFIPTIASQVYLVLDKTMIGAFASTSIENGYYEQAQKVIRICWTFVTTFATVMSPRVAYAYAQKNRDLMKQYMRDSFRFVWFIASPIAFGILGVATNLVPWFFGYGYDKVSSLLLIFSIIVFPIGISSVTGSQYLVSIQKQTTYTASILAGACINFGLNLFLIPRLFSVGAAIASVIAEIVIAVVQVVYLVCVLKDIKMRDVFNSAWRYFLSGAVMCGIVTVESHCMKPIWTSTAILVLTGASVYSIMLILLKDDIIANIIEKIKYTVCKKRHKTR